MEIRKARMDELDRIMEIYAAAREYMARTGNPHQWGRVYPPRALIAADIEKGYCHVGEGPEGAPCCVFALIEGGEPAYAVIEDGEWLNDAPYLTVHRVASDGTCRGVLTACMGWVKARGMDIRIDTHRDNSTMRHLLTKNGFVRCGIVHLADGAERVGYQWRSE